MVVCMQPKKATSIWWSGNKPASVVTEVPKNPESRGYIRQQGKFVQAWKGKAGGEGMLASLRQPGFIFSSKFYTMYFLEIFYPFFLSWKQSFTLQYYVYFPFAILHLKGCYVPGVLAALFGNKQKQNKCASSSDKNGSCSNVSLPRICLPPVTSIVCKCKKSKLRCSRKFLTCWTAGEKFVAWCLKGLLEYLLTRAPNSI